MRCVVPNGGERRRSAPKRLAKKANEAHAGAAPSETIFFLIQKQYDDSLIASDRAFLSIRLLWLARISVSIFAETSRDTQKDIAMTHTQVHAAQKPTHDATSDVVATSTALQIVVPLSTSAAEGKAEPTVIDQSLQILPGDVETGLMALATFETELRKQDAEEKAADDEGGIYNINFVLWGPAEVRVVPAWVDPTPLLAQPGRTGFSLFQALHQTFTVQRILQMIFGTSPEAKAVHRAALNHILACAAMSRMAPHDDRRTGIDHRAYHDVCAAMSSWLKANRAH